MMSDLQRFLLTILNCTVNWQKGIWKYEEKLLIEWCRRKIAAIILCAAGDGNYE